MMFTFDFDDSSSPAVVGDPVSIDGDFAFFSEAAPEPNEFLLNDPCWAAPLCLPNEVDEPNDELRHLVGGNFEPLPKELPMMMPPDEVHHIDNHKTTPRPSSTSAAVVVAMPPPSPRPPNATTMCNSKRARNDVKISYVTPNHNATTAVTPPSTTLVQSPQSSLVVRPSSTTTTTMMRSTSDDHHTPSGAHKTLLADVDRFLKESQRLMSEPLRLPSSPDVSDADFTTAVLSVKKALLKQIADSREVQTRCAERQEATLRVLMGDPSDVNGLPLELRGVPLIYQLQPLLNALQQQFDEKI